MSVEPKAATHQLMEFRRREDSPWATVLEGPFRIGSHECGSATTDR